MWVWSPFKTSGRCWKTLEVLRVSMSANISGSCVTANGSRWGSREQWLWSIPSSVPQSQGGRMTSLWATVRNSKTLILLSKSLTWGTNRKKRSFRQASEKNEKRNCPSVLSGRKCQNQGRKIVARMFSRVFTSRNRLWRLFRRRKKFSRLNRTCSRQMASTLWWPVSILSTESHPG